MTTFSLRSADPAKTKADAVVVGVHSGESPTLAPGAEKVAAAYGRKLNPLLSTLGVTGKAGDVTKVPTGGTITSPLLVLVGLGPVPSATSPSAATSGVTADGRARAGVAAPSDDTLAPAVVRRAAGAAARAVTNAASVALALPADSPALVGAAVEGYLLGGYTFTTYKKDTSTQAPAEVVVLTADARRKETTSAVEEAQVRAAAVAGTRDWVNTPAGDLRPPGFAEAVVAAAKPHARGGHKVAVTVHDEQALAALGCGGLLGVGAGSDAPPRLVELRYAPKGATRHLALVGKGITFDSGGLSIKPAQGMHEMKTDMAGAAAVVQATLAIAALKLPVRVTTYAAMAENMVSGSATRPGDVLTLRGGTTVEVFNTDAEGRLVLGDALVMADEAEPDLVIDVATLTGAMVVALGDKVAGVMGDQAVVDRVLEAADAAGEDFWPMPIPEQMTERVHSSKVADLAQHDWVRWGGGLFAAAFLREFTGGRPWAHLDIAGPAFASGGPSGHVPSGGTGVAVTTLVELARSLSTETD